MDNKVKLIKSQLKPIKLTLTHEAVRQIKLIQENDYTLEGKVFKIKISGKGCNGFEYATCFDAKAEDDISVIVDQIEVALDPFTAFYLYEGHVDYIVQPENNIDGFTVKNHNENLFQGKFFKDDSLVPKI